MRDISFDEIVKSPYSDKAFVRNDFPGFREDYLALHSLIRKYQTATFMEIGTSTGLGTKVICTAMGIGRFQIFKTNKRVYSVDVSPGTDPKIIYPEGEDGHPSRPGKYCNLPYTQILGNSLNFDFSQYYPIDGWFIDGKHNYEYAKNDTKLALKSNPTLIVWHDMQIQGVADAVLEVMKQQNNYDLFKVLDTRIAFAVSG